MYYLFSFIDSWSLVRLFPLIVGSLIPEDNPNWLYYLQLLDIIDHIFTPVVHPDTPPYYLIHIPRYLQRQVNVNIPNVFN